MQYTLENLVIFLFLLLLFAAALMLWPDQLAHFGHWASREFSHWLAARTS